MSPIAFKDSSGTSVLELGMMLMLLRSDHASLFKMADEFAGHFKTPVDVEDLTRAHLRLCERDWLERHPRDPSRTLVTDVGKRVAYSAFGGFVRLVDPTGQYFKASVVFALTTRLDQEIRDDD